MIRNCEKTAQSLPPVAEMEQLAEGVCPVDWARTVAKTAWEANCGQGTFCRDGLAQVFTIIDDIARDKGRSGDLELLAELCGDIVAMADCELSVGCAQRVLASLEGHRAEWEAHLDRKRCTALVCRGCYTVHVDPAKCTGCGQCMAVCPDGCIAGGEGMIHVVDSSACSRCGKCFEACPAGAFMKAGAVKPRVPEAPVPVGSFSTGATRRRRRPGGGA